MPAEVPLQVASHVAEALSRPILAFDHTRTYSKGRKRVETHVERSGVSVSGMDFLALGGALLGLSAAMFVLGVGVRPATDDERSTAKAGIESQLSDLRVELAAAKDRLQDLIDHPYEQPQWERKVAQWTARIQALEAEIARLEKLLMDEPLGPPWRVERRPRITEWNVIGALPLGLPSLPAVGGLFDAWRRITFPGI